MKLIAAAIFTLAFTLTSAHATNGTESGKEIIFKVETVGKYSSATLDSSNMEEARSLAEEALKEAPKYKYWGFLRGAAQHHGNLVLGRIQLIQGNIEAAKIHLERAAQTEGSPVLKSFGPNMTLAKELLLRGEKEAVLRYLDACLAFWNTGHAQDKIAEWKNAIHEGKIPNFKGNLVYRY